MSVDDLDRLLGALPERVVVLLDEALVDFADAQPADASLGLLARHPRLVIFRSLSKAWGLAGLRTGYAIAAPGSAALLEQHEPDLGVDELAQAGALEALRSTADHVARRAADAARERDRVIAGLRELGVEVGASQANVLWMRVPDVDGATIAGLLQQQKVIVQPGGAIGEPEFFRAAVHLREHGDRLLRGVEVALESTSGAVSRAAR
jgi:histidinol-phosphate aminotransferase